MTMKFADFQKMFTKHSKQVLAEGNLFLLDIDRDLLWETYLESFPAHGNKVFRERREMDCSCCRSAVKSIGGLVAITDKLDVVTLWDFDTNDDIYQPMLEAMRELLRANIDRAFFTKDGRIGTKVNVEELPTGSIEWRHLYLEVPAQYVTPDVAAKQEERRALASVFQRSLKEITAEAINTVLDLVDEDMLYKGVEWKGALTKLRQLHATYSQTPPKKRSRFAWRESALAGVAVAKIKNHSIGTLLTDLSEGMDVSVAVRRYEKVVAPENYKHPKPVYTKQMVEKAERTVVEMGLADSLSRRFGRVDDVRLENVRWANHDAKRKGGKLGVFEAMREDIAINPSKFEKIQGISIEEFMALAQGFHSMELLFEGRHEPNLMSLIAPQNRNAPSLFKWRNGMGWGYKDELADSSMKQQVRDAGGFGDGFFRYSIRWNKEGDNLNDYDAHCRWDRGHINFANKKVGNMELDVDIIRPVGVAVENITGRRAQDIPKAKFRLSVHCFSHNGGTNGFDCEVELAGDLYYYNYPHNIPYKSMVHVADVEWDGERFTITHLIPVSKGGASSREVWGINTNQFHPVSMVMHSPNHWEGEAGIGNKHFFFFLNGCVNDGTPRGFYNEFLHNELDPHRKVFEALASRMKVEASSEQLSGLGFSTTQRNSFIVRADGKKIYKVVI